MAARPTQKNDRATIRRTLHYFWGVTRQKMGAFALSIVELKPGYIALLTFAILDAMGLIVDRVEASPRLWADQVLPVFGPYVLGSSCGERRRRRSRVL